jgi:cell division protease FtsH
MRKKPIDPDVDVNLLARRTPGFVGADLENLINEAALLAARKKKKLIGMVDLQEAIDRVIAGPARKSRVVNPKEREIIAYHELGHAIVGIALPHANTVHKVTIIPHGTAALGYTESLPLEDRFLMSKDELYENITAILAGRAAEEIIFNEITTGAANDLQKASGLAKKMVTEFGMSDKLGPIFWGKEEGDVFLGKELTKMSHFSEEIASQIDAEIKKIIFETYEKCKNIIIKFKDKMHEAAKVLLEKEVLSGEELAEIVDMKEKGNYYRETEYEREVDKEVKERDKENVKKQEEMSEKSDENKGDVV